MKKLYNTYNGYYKDNTVEGLVKNGLKEGLWKFSTIHEYASYKCDKMHGRAAIYLLGGYFYEFYLNNHLYGQSISK